jgi:hypothetical protein
MASRRALTSFLIIVWQASHLEPSAAATTKRKSTTSGAQLCAQRWSFDKSSHKLFIPSNSPVQFTLAGKGEKDFSLSETSKDGATWLQFPEGEHRFSLSSSTAQEYRIISDGTAPKTIHKFTKTPYYQKANATYYGRGYKLSLDPTDNLAGVDATYIGMNGGPLHVETQKGFSFDHDGPISVDFFSCDRVGNQETPFHYSFIVDLTPPTTSFQVRGHQQKSILGRDAQIIITSIDSGSGIDTIQYQFDSGPKLPYQSPLQLIDLTPGPHRLTYSSVDHVTNSEAPKTFAFVYDPSPPISAINVSGPTYVGHGLTYVSSITAIQVTTTDRDSPVASTGCAWDGGKSVACGNRVGLPDRAGQHKLLVTAVDVVGNKVDLEKEIFIDRTSPAITWDIRSPHIWQNGAAKIAPGTKIGLTSIDEGCGTKDISYCVDDSKCKPWKDDLTFDIIGPHTIKATAIDQVGNKSAESVLHLIVERPAENKLNSAGVDVKKAWVADNTAGAIGPAGKPFLLQVSESPTAAAYTIEIPQDMADALMKNSEKHEIKLSVGKFSGIATLPIDHTPPKTSIHYATAKSSVKPEGTVFGGGLTVSLTAVDDQTGNISGLEQIQYSVNGQGLLPYRAVVHEFATEQQYQFSYRSMDRVGNQEALLTEKFSVDLTPPITELKLTSGFFQQYVTPDAVLELNAKDNLAGVDRISFAWDQNAFKSYSRDDMSKVQKTLTEGPHKFRYLSSDLVGNREAEKSHDVVVDATPPRIAYEIVGPFMKEKSGLNFINKSARIMLKASDANSGVDHIEYTMDGGPVETYRSLVSLPDDTKEHVLEFSAIDRLQHRSAAQRVRLQTTTVAPQTMMTFIGASSYFGSRLYLDPGTKIVLTSQDNESGVKEIMYRIGSGDFVPYTHPIGFTTASELDFSFFAINHVGQREAARQFRLIFDGATPQVSLSVDKRRKNDAVDVLAHGSQLRISAADGQSGVKEIFYQINDSGRRLYRGPIELKEKGKFRLNVIAMDWVQHEQKTAYPFEVE